MTQHAFILAPGLNARQYYYLVHMPVGGFIVKYV